MKVTIESANKFEVSDGFHTFEELYEHRILLFIALCTTIPDKCFWMNDKNGWLIVFLELPTGQISYHMPDKYSWMLKNFTCIGKSIWDQHQKHHVVARLANFIEDSQREALK